MRATLPVSLFSTPGAIRIRKRFLQETDRALAEKRAEAKRDATGTPA